MPIPRRLARHLWNGPFKFVSWNANTAIQLTRFDDYRGSKPKVANVTFTIYQSLDTAFADLLANAWTSWTPFQLRQRRQTRCSANWVIAQCRKLPG